MPSDVTSQLRAKDMNAFQVGAVAICIFLNMLDGFDVLVIAFTAAAIAAEWGLSPTALGVLFSAGLAGMTAGSILIAPLADKIGRRAMILIALYVISIGMLMSAYAESVTTLAWLRVFTGLGIGMMLPSLNTIVAEYVSDKRRDFSISLLAVGYSIGATVGGILTVLLIGEFGWRSAFVLGGVASLIMIPIVMFQLPESLDFLLHKKPKDALQNINTLLARLDISGLDRLPQHSEHQAKKGRFSDIFKGALLPETLRICTGYFMVMLTFYFLINWTPKILVDLGVSNAMGISGSVLMNVGGVIGGTLLGYLTHRFNLRDLAMVYMGLCFVFSALFGFLPYDVVLLMGVAFLLGFAMVGSMTSLYAIVPQIYPASLRNTGTGFAIGTGRFGATAGPYLAGLMISADWDRSLYYVVLGAPVLISIVAVRGIAVLKKT